MNAGDVGAVVRDARHRRGWTQQQLADRAGLNQTMLARLEAASRNKPAFRTLEKIAQGLDMELVVSFTDP